MLRSKTPDLVRQEFYGLLMAHFAIRGLMHEAALKADKCVWSTANWLFMALVPPRHRV